MTPFLGCFYRYDARRPAISTKRVDFFACEANPWSVDLNQAALAAQSAANFVELERIAREMIRLGEASGDPAELGRAYTFLGNAKLHVRDGAAAEAAYQTAQRIYEAAGDRHGLARVHMNLGAVAFDLHLDVETARRYFSSTLPVFAEFGDRFRYGVALGNLSEVARLDGNYESAAEYARRAYDVFSEIGDSDRCTWMTLDLAHYAWLAGDEREARERLEAAHELLAVNHNVIWTAVYFELWMMIALAHGEREIAARLLRFADAYRESHRTPRLQGMLPWLGPVIMELHASPAYPQDGSQNETPESAAALVSELKNRLVEA